MRAEVAGGGEKLSALGQHVVRAMAAGLLRLLRFLLFPPGPPPGPVLLGPEPFPTPAPSRVGFELEAFAGDALYAVLSTFMAVHVSWSLILIAATFSRMSTSIVDLHS